MELPVKLEYDTTYAEQAHALAERWDASRSATDFSQFSDEDIKHFNSNQKSTLTHSSFFSHLVTKSLLQLQF